jgi:putative nucleotidyltransferase with HDIG domain
VVIPVADPSPLLRDRLLVHPRAAERVLQLLSAEDGAHGELCALVELDPALTAAVVRAANATHLGYARRIAGARHAIVLLGGGLVASLAASRVADLVFDTGRPDYPDWLWQHSLAVASGCAVLAGEIGEPVDDAYTTGLLHDVGALLAATNGVDPELDHCDDGAELLRRWNLPDKVVGGVRHQRARAAGMVGSLERLVAAASCFAAELGAPGPERTVSPTQALGLVQVLRRPDDVLAQIEDDLARRTAVARGS